MVVYAVGLCINPIVGLNTRATSMATRDVIRKTLRRSPREDGRHLSAARDNPGGAERRLRP